MLFRWPAFLAFIVLATTLFAAGSFAESTFADWSVGKMPDNMGLYAATRNDGGLVFGEYCYSKTGKCLWLIGTGAACDRGHHYPVLANTDAGSTTLEIICAGGPLQLSGKTVYTYSFSDWNRLNSLVRKSTRFGLAVPMKSDQFEAWRFSLNGLLAATSAMEAAFMNSLQKTGPKSQGTLTTTL